MTLAGIFLKSKITTTTRNDCFLTADNQEPQPTVTLQPTTLCNCYCILTIHSHKALPDYERHQLQFSASFQFKVVGITFQIVLFL